MTRYKVVRAFERHDGKALRKFTRGSIISPKDAAKMAIRPEKKRQSTIEVLLSSGAILAIPEEVTPIDS
jgi:hypothetical protein